VIPKVQSSKQLVHFPHIGRPKLVYELFSCFIIHRRSIAERGGCFQRRLSVCLSTR